MENSLSLRTKKYIKNLVRILFKYLYRIEIKGLENYPVDIKKPLVIVANHVSLLDGIILWLFLPDELTFAVDIFTIQKWWASWTTKFSCIFAIDSTKPMAIKSLIEHVSRNNHCVIFPEGRITTTGGLMKIYAGPGLIANRAKAEILPIHIEGAQFTYFSHLKNKQKLHLFPKIKLTIFPPQNLIVSSDIKGRLRRKILSEKLYEILCETAFFSQDTSKTLFESLLESQKLFGRNKVIVQDITQKTLTYQQLIMRCFILSKPLKTLTEPKENIGIFLPNANGYIVVFFALQLLCRIPTLLNFSMSAQQIIKCCKTASLKTVLSTRKFLEIPHLKDKISAMQNSEIEVIFIDDFAAEISFLSKLNGFIKSFFPKLSYKKWKKIKDTSQQTISSTAIIIFTSGSEGDPKGVALSYKNLQSNRFQLLTRITFTPQDVVFNALPLFHVFSLNGGLFVPLFSGLCTFLYPTPLHLQKIPELCYEIKPTILFSTDTFLANYGKYANSFDFYNLRYVFAGAEKLKDTTYQLWLTKFGLRIFEGYGTTETSPILAVNNIQQNKPGTVGKLLPGIEYQLKPVEGIAEGGELFVKGPNIMFGYLGFEKITPPKDGWYSTGDVVSFDSEGFLTILDRLKRFAKIGGEMVSLSGVEICISKLWPGFYHAALAISDARKGEQIILATTCPSVTRQSIISQANELGLSNLAIPKAIYIIDKMPLLSTGKIDYPSLKLMENLGN